MKTKVISILLLIFGLVLNIHANGKDGQKIFTAIDLNGTVCGYSEIYISDSLINGKECIVLKQNTFANFHALGKDISQHQRFTYYIDKESGNFIYHDSYFKQGEMEMGGNAYVEGNRIRIVEINGNETIMDLPEGTILPNTQFYPYLIDEEVDEASWIKKFMVYDVRTGKPTEMVYDKVGDEKIDFAGNTYDAIIVEEKNTATGITNKLWIHKKDGMRLQMENPQKIKIYVTDAGVPKRISTGNWDFNFFVKTNENISNIRAISYMKSNVKLKGTPASSEEDLNVPGQKFTGSINENAIDGEFIVKHMRYDGKNAPVFPFEAGNFDFDNIFMTAGESIESDDPEIKALAEKLTEGSENSWEACRRISSWAVNNIDGSILDGSAKETLESRSGLCGAQSKLMAALCRASGIPARVVWGVMYTREYDGSFGHHAWTEVFMGDAGWIPVDVTIHETDYVDSGHIRLGVLKTERTVIEFEEIEILDYKTDPF